MIHELYINKFRRTSPKSCRQLSTSNYIRGGLVVGQWLTRWRVSQTHAACSRAPLGSRQYATGRITTSSNLPLYNNPYVAGTSANQVYTTCLKMETGFLLVNWSGPPHQYLCACEAPGLPDHIIHHAPTTSGHIYNKWDQLLPNYDTNKLGSRQYATSRPATSSKPLPNNLYAIRPWSYVDHERDQLL